MDTKRYRIYAVFIIALSISLAACGGGGGDDGPLSSAKAITAFSIVSPSATGTIDENAKTISVTVPYGTNVTALVATFTTTGVSVKVGATFQVSGTTPNDFTNPVAYVVTAEDSSTATYAVTVMVALNSAKAITAFSFTSPAATGTIDENAKTISVTVPYGTNVTALVATFTTTGASVKVGPTIQVNGTTPNDFTNPVPYLVTAADNSTETYTVSVTVYAGVIALPATGQTRCYDSAGAVITCTNTGQDGALQKGVAWPNPKFTTNADTSITDNLTGLSWAPSGNLMVTRDSGWDTDLFPNDGEVTWQHALDYVAKLNAESYLGHTDWRLPNWKELRSLAMNSATWLSTQGFSDVQVWGYWSSTTDAADTADAWFVYMKDGDTSSDAKTWGHYVWPVRGESPGYPAHLGKTGQSTSYDANTVKADDGALQKGVAWPNPRFTTNADTAVTDHLTGLVWAPNGNLMTTRDSGWDADNFPNDGLVTWQHALDYVAKLNAESYLGHTDWRLPNLNELESLIHAEYTKETICGGSCAYNPAWLTTQGFGNVQYGNYWTSTTYNLSTSGAWVVTMIDGNLWAYIKTSNYHYVWAVRGGQ